jgi:hypothetical protein
MLYPPLGLFSEVFSVVAPCTLQSISIKYNLLIAIDLKINREIVWVFFIRKKKMFVSNVAKNSQSMKI